MERVLLASGVGNEADGTVPLNDITSDVKRALERLKTSMVRAGMVGGALKGGLNLAPSPARKRGVRRAAAADAVRDTVSFAAFLVAFRRVRLGRRGPLPAITASSAATVARRRRRRLRGPHPPPRRRCRPRSRRRPPTPPRTRHPRLAPPIVITSRPMGDQPRPPHRDSAPTPRPLRLRSRRRGPAMASATVILSCFILKPEALRARRLLG